MDLNFKDKRSAKLFDEISITISSEKIDKIHDEIDDDKSLYEDLFESEYKEVDELVNIDNKKAIKLEKEVMKYEKTTLDIIEIKSKINLQTQQLSRIESKQNAILEILESVPLPTVSQVKASDIVQSDIEMLKLNLELFNSKLIILSTKSDNKHIQNLLLLLEKVSEYLKSNSFYAFTKESSPINKILYELNYLGMGDGKLNELIDATQLLVKNIDRYSKDKIFEKSYYFANLLLTWVRQ